MPIVQFEATPAEANRLSDVFAGFRYMRFMHLDNQYRPTTDLAKVAYRKFGMSGHRAFLSPTSGLIDNSDAPI